MILSQSREKPPSEMRSRCHLKHAYEEEAFKRSQLALSEKNAVQSLCLSAMSWANKKSQRDLFEGSNKKALDIGCAYGYVTSLLEQLGYDPAGLDISRYALKMGEKVDRMRGDAEYLPLKSGAVDMITCFDTFEHLGHPTLLLEECYRCLRRGGVLIIENPIANPIDVVSDKLHKMSEIHCSLLAPRDFISSIHKVGFRTVKRGLLPIPFQRFPVLGRFIELPVPVLVARRMLILAIKS